MISRVVVVGDPYRGDQAINIEKLKNIFSPVFRQLGVAVSAYVFDINFESEQDRWVPAWEKTLMVYPECALESMDLRDCAVIGFEVPDAELKYLSGKNVPWINFCIHPLRFLDDLYFDVASSFSFNMEGMVASSGLIEVCVNRFKKYKGIRNGAFIPKTLLIAGQDSVDRSIYFDGKFCQIDDYLRELDSLVGDFDRVLYKPHPAHRSQRVAEILGSRYGAIECAELNIYDLLANQDVDAVCAISSSVLTEAPFFGVKSIFLDSRARRYGPPIDYKALLDNFDFWQKGFLNRVGVNGALNISRGIPSNYLRKIFWSWGFVTDEGLLESRILQLESRVTGLEVQTKEQVQRAAAEAGMGAHELPGEGNGALAAKYERLAEQSASQIQTLEQRAAQAEARAKEVEQRLAHAHGQVLELLQRTERAETECAHEKHQSAMTQSKLERAEADLGSVRRELHDVHQTNHRHWQLAEARRHALQTVHASLSWKLTAPFRFVVGLFVHPGPTLRNTANYWIRSAIQLCQKPLSYLMAFVLRRPKLSGHINQWLLRCYPHLYQQLLDVAHRNGVVGSTMSSPIYMPSQAGIRAAPKSSRLNPRALQIYTDLQAAFERNQRID